MLSVKEMTPEQKLGRVLCIRHFKTQEDIDFALELVKKQACGALQIPFNKKTRELVKLFRDAAEYPVIIVNDMESKFPLSSLPPTNMMTLAACNNLEYVRAFAASVASMAKSYGYSGCWSPIIDIARGANPTGIGRIASDSPEYTEEIATEILKVFDSYNFHGTAKHYPGSSGTPYDTHMVEDAILDSEEELCEFNLKPYLALMEKGLLPAIMSRHAAVKYFDNFPTSLSKKAIDMIRKRGFNGVFYTDSLAMSGIMQKYGDKDAMAMALMAGNDIILTNFRTPLKELYGMMLESYREGKITDERLDEAVTRVMALEQYCAKEPENPYPVPDNIEEIIQAISRDCITADCAAGISTAIDTDTDRLFIIVTPQSCENEFDTPEIASEKWYSPQNICNAIKSNFPNSHIELIKEFPTALDNDRVITTAAKFNEVVFVTFCSAAAYQGTNCLTRRIEAVITSLALPKKICAIVHFGNPLALSNIDCIENVPRIIFGYGAPPSQQYAIDVLAGKIKAKGEMPFPSLYKSFNNSK